MARRPGRFTARGRLARSNTHRERTRSTTTGWHERGCVQMGNAARAPALRFTVGERVRCRVSQSEWAPGCVAQLWYHEPGWPETRLVPYQVELDDGRLIFAPLDKDELIRAEATFEKLLYAEEREGEQANARYREDIEARFTRKHPAIYEPAELQRFLNPALKDALRSGGEATLRALWNEEAQGLYSLRLFTAEFCELLLEECEHFEAWCAASDVRLHRPNTMNNHGAILDDFGFGPMMDAIMRQCVQPLARLAGYADVVGGEGRLRTHHAFIVSYELGKDTDLNFHVDRCAAP